jgi:hypothetical protein
MESDNHQDSLALRQEGVVSKDESIVEEKGIPVSEGIGIIYEDSLALRQERVASEDEAIVEEKGIPVSEGIGIVYEDSLALRQERVVSENEVIVDEKGIPVSEGIGIIPVSEDPDLISVSEHMPDQLAQSSQEEGEQQDLPVTPVHSVLADREYRDSLNVASRVQGSSLQPSGRRDGKRRSRLSVWLAISLVALVLIGLICWLLFLQLAPDTNPWQSFSDTKLGFSVSYPTDWQVKVDDKQSVVHFHDSTQTGRVDIVVSSGATASDIVQFLQQRASQLGITNITTGPSRSFAGTSWQQVQGKLSQEGVHYSVTMLAARHGSHLYLLTQSSPQSTYADEDALIFSVMRAVLRLS